MTKRRQIPKPFSELSLAEKIRETRAAIGRLEDSLNAEYRNPNRSHVVTTNLYDAIKRQNETLTRLMADPEIHKLSFSDL